MGASTGNGLISDRDVNRLGLLRFRAASISLDKRTIEVCYEGPYCYKIPIEYILSWYTKGPHEMAEALDRCSVEVMEDPEEVELRLEDGSIYRIAWDVVLMACEPTYEHFGGFTEYSKRNSSSWLLRHGSFKIFSGTDVH